MDGYSVKGKFGIQEAVALTVGFFPHLPSFILMLGITTHFTDHLLFFFPAQPLNTFSLLHNSLVPVNFLLIFTKPFNHSSLSL